jgi:TrpR-related protein YerC/YecD
MRVKKPRPDKALNSRAADEQALYGAFSILREPREAELFLRDLATPAELAAFAERWRIARMLDEGGHSYREIAAVTGASTTTIGRVARFLREEKHQGYRLILDRVKTLPGAKS